MMPTQHVRHAELPKSQIFQKFSRAKMERKPRQKGCPPSSYWLAAKGSSLFSDRAGSSKNNHSLKAGLHARMAIANSPCPLHMAGTVGGEKNACGWWPLQVYILQHNRIIIVF
jgi:hypothetical protein